MKAEDVRKVGVVGCGVMGAGIVEVWARAGLDEVTGPEVILASNTSSIPIVDLAAATKRPKLVVGLHFFNPVPVMGLIEVVKAITTSDETVEFARAFGAVLGKTTVLSKDRAG